MEGNSPFTKDSESSSDSFLDSFEKFLKSLDINAMDAIANVVDVNAMDANAMDANPIDPNVMDAHEIERNTTRAFEENSEISGQEKVGILENKKT